MSIIDELKNNEQHALKELFDCYGQAVYRLAFRIVKNQFDAEDIVQEVFFKLWNVRSSLDDKGNIWSLLYVMTKRQALNKLRDSVILASVNTDLADRIMHSSTADSPTHALEIDSLEKSVVKMLPKQQQQIYLMSREEGLSYKEIADRLDISPNTVRNHIVQSLKFFRKAFQKYGYHFILFFSFFH